MSSTNTKIKAPDMVYISGEEMTHEVMNMVIDKWVTPYIDTARWKHFDLSCKHRDHTDDQVLTDAIEAGKNIGAIFKEPTITAKDEQVKEMGLSKPQGSPNGAMRRGWNGLTIDRDTIPVPDAIKGQMGYERPVLFSRQAVGGQYGAQYDLVGPGHLKMVHTTADGTENIIGNIQLKDQRNGVVMYHNPLDRNEELARHFFERTLKANVVPIIVTKKTVFKWQEPFWEAMNGVYEAEYKQKFEDVGMTFPDHEGLCHLLSDDAAMKLDKWRKGGYAMVAHNYDGDWLTDELAQIYKSPGFISSTLIGKRDDGTVIKEFEASHGTVSDQYKKHLQGKETSVNPLGLVHALRGAMDHASDIAITDQKMSANDVEAFRHFTTSMYDAMMESMADGKGTKDLFGMTKGLTTEGFIDEVASRIAKKMQ